MNSTLILECKCDPKGSSALDCNDKGDCICNDGFTGSKCDECNPNVVGDKCDACESAYFGYPNCKGLYKNLKIKDVIKIELNLNFRMQM